MGISSFFKSFTKNTTSVSIHEIRMAWEEFQIYEWILIVSSFLLHWRPRKCFNHWRMKNHDLYVGPLILHGRFIFIAIMYTLVKKTFPPHLIIRIVVTVHNIKNKVNKVLVWQQIIIINRYWCKWLICQVMFWIPFSIPSLMSRPLEHLSASYRHFGLIVHRNNRRSWLNMAIWSDGVFNSIIFTLFSS